MSFFQVISSKTFCKFFHLHYHLLKKIPKLTSGKELFVLLLVSWTMAIKFNEMLVRSM